MSKFMFFVAAMFKMVFAILTFFRCCPVCNLFREIVVVVVEEEEEEGRGACEPCK